MIEEYLTLRNKLYVNNFRCELSADLWAAHYLPDTSSDTCNIVRAEKDGVIEGYAVYTVLDSKNIKACKILEICASSREVLKQLIDNIVNRAVEENIDFVFIRKGEEPLDSVFDESEFISFTDCVIMSALLNPRELLTSVSENIDHGVVIELRIKGFDPIHMRMMRGKIKVVEKAKPSVTVKTDSKTFLELFFGKSSFLKAFIQRKVTIKNPLNIAIIARFFSIIKQENSHIPQGEWN